MKNKPFVFLISLSLLLSGMLVAGAHEEKNIADNNKSILSTGEPAPPKNLTIEHSDPRGELLENGFFEKNYEPWGLTRLQDEGYAVWSENTYTAEGNGSIKIQAVQTGDGNTTEESFWEQDVVNTSSNITVNGAFNKEIMFQDDGCSMNNATAKIQVNDTREGWQTIYSDTNTSEQGSEWVEFGPNATYEPVGKVTSIRAYMHLESQGYAIDQTTWGEIWMDDISVFSESSGGNDHNLLTWNASIDDPADVSHYNMYRSDDREGPWANPIDSVEADGSINYSYLDEDKGMVDDTYWWYVVRTVGDNGTEENNTNEKQEAFRVDSIEVDPQESMITAGESQQYNTTAHDKEGNEIRDVTKKTTWSSDIDTENRTWDQNVIIVEESGTWTITAEYENETTVLTNTSTLNVEPAEVDYVLIGPDENQNIPAGNTIDFNASAYDRYDNLVYDDDTNFTWKNTDNTGLFNKTTSGEYNVTATYEGVTSNISTVTVEPAEVATVEIDPENDQMITEGETIDFDAEAYDQFGNLVTDTDSDFDWQNADDTTGEFDTAVPGEFNVTATYESVTSEVTKVTVLEEYDMTINSTTGGSVTVPGEDTFTYDEGTVVDLSAVADQGYKFIEWTGDTETVEDPTSNETEMEMKDDCTITARFEELEAEFDVSNFYVQEDGLEVTITADVENIGDVEGEIELVIDEDIEHPLTVEAGETESLNYTHEFDEEGEHDIKFGDQSETITVQEDGMAIGTPMIMGMIAFVVMVLAILGYIMMGGEGTEAEPMVKKEQEEVEITGEEEFGKEEILEEPEEEELLEEEPEEGSDQT